MARAKFTAVPGLDSIVARMCVPAIDQIADATETLAKAKAPPTKEWVSRRDGKVRHSHVMVDGSVLPVNLRFTLVAFAWDVQHPQYGGVRDGLDPINKGQGWDGPEAAYAASSTYLLEPRDRTGEHFVQITRCRCAILRDPLGVARMVGKERAQAIGSKVTAKVYAEGEHVFGAEFGDDYPLPSHVEVEPGTRFMRDTAAEMRVILGL